jgi:YHS domain-containing protein
MKHVLPAWLCGVLMMLVSLRASAEPALNSNGTSYAIGGYDVVGYFSDQHATRGTKEHASQYGGATWLFATRAHKELFDKQPSKYVPAYRGYCAYGVSRGYLVKIEPEAFTVRDGTLYLNYSLDVRATWLKDPAGYIDKANHNWPKL